MFHSRTRSSWLGSGLSVLLIALLSGCDNIEWNWDTTWWKPQRRVVQPAKRPTTPPSSDTRRTAKAEPVEEEAPIATERPTTAPSAKPAARPAETAGARPRVVERPVTPATAERKTYRRDLPYYQLYLLGPSVSASVPSPDQATVSSERQPAEDTSSGKDQEQRGEQTVRLMNARAGDCAVLLEMLYVPVGRSGNIQETYLLYQEIAEFEKAVALAPLLDVGGEGQPAVAGPEGAFRAGLTKLLRIVAAGPETDRGLVDDCEHDLAQVVQSSDSTPQLRWASAILVGRVVSDYRYDYADARSYYRQAERAAAPQSIEWMTARWWLADSFLQEGQRKDAVEIYQGIIADCSAKWKNSQIVMRAREAVDRRKK